MNAAEFSEWLVESPRRVTRTLFWLADTGPKADIMDVCVSALLRGATVTRSEVVADLDSMVGRGLLTRSGQTYVMTEDTIGNLVQGVAMGCTQSELLTAPPWIRALATGEDVVGAKDASATPLVIPDDAWKLDGPEDGPLYVYPTAHGVMLAGGNDRGRRDGVEFSMLLDGRCKRTLADVVADPPGDWRVTMVDSYETRLSHPTHAEVLLYGLTSRAPWVSAIRTYIPENYRLELRTAAHRAVAELLAAFNAVSGGVG